MWGWRWKLWSMGGVMKEVVGEEEEERMEREREVEWGKGVGRE